MTNRYTPEPRTEWEAVYWNVRDPWASEPTGPVQINQRPTIYYRPVVGWFCHDDHGEGEQVAMVPHPTSDAVAVGSVTQSAASLWGFVGLSYDRTRDGQPVESGALDEDWETSNARKHLAAWLWCIENIKSNTRINQLKGRAELDGHDSEQVLSTSTCPTRTRSIRRPDSSPLTSRPAVVCLHRPGSRSCGW